ncbi:uncharacterized protein LOC135812412 [Sycon ciliatum]|uniref:uncharacterized protein LOC135812412 n=1 Tax=Sycon ciliatum TaxID=27933 RepID=UPI0031F5F6D1
MSSHEDEALLLGRAGDRPMSKQMELVRACGAEFMATLLFVLVGVTAVRGNEVNEGVNVLPVALAHGFMIFLLVAMTANVSGGHINPAVSLGVFLAGEISFVRFILYFLFQLLGATVGAALALGLNVDWRNRPQRIQEHRPAVHWLAVATGIMASGTLTGGSMNPARSFGPAVISLHGLGDYPNAQGKNYYSIYWSDQWIYFLGPLLGAGVASGIYRFILSSQHLKRLSINDS